MTTLIFEPTLSGHHIEYLHHIYMGAIERADNKYIFAIPAKEWDTIRDKCDWPTAKNIIWHGLNDEDCQSCNNGSMLLRSYKLSKLIRRIAINLNADYIKLISLAGAIPVLPLILPNRIKVSGIIYKIYLRAHKKGIRRLLDNVRYFIMSHNKSVDKVFILNDPRSADNLNRIYGTNKFVTLADPVPEVDITELTDLRPKLGISADSKIFLHFGAMDKRKGTLEILQALCLMTPEEHQNRTFIFAGRINKEIKSEFDELMEKAQTNGVNMIVRDEFCSFGYLNSLCHTCDCILIPYLLTDLSSGALGYAAVHRKPVIGPCSGLIGELIRDNNLGVTLPIVSPLTIKKAIIDCNFSVEENKYAEKNNINKFTKVLLS